MLLCMSRGAEKKVPRFMMHNPRKKDSAYGARVKLYKTEKTQCTQLFSF
jgi:hypothetical protein